MTTVSINYVGKIVESINHLQFRNTPPIMCVLKCVCKKCRLMGCKRPITSLDDLPVKVLITRIQSVTVTVDLGRQINLNRLGGMYEPEIFPAARLVQFNPLCVNVFASGKVVILGLRSLHRHEKIIQRLTNQIFLANI